MRHLSGLILLLFVLNPSNVNAKTMLDALVVIPLAYERPDGVYVELDETSKGYAEDAVARLEDDVETLSGGMGDLSVTIEYLAYVPESLYANNDGWFVSGQLVAELFPTYDLVFVITDPDAVTTWYKGLTSYPSGETWILGDENAGYAAIHELGHMLEIILNENGYYLDACEDLPASLMHCAIPWGYGEHYSEAFFVDFYSGNGFGLTQDMWDVIQEATSWN
jgi:hypothetical protein